MKNSFKQALIFSMASILGSCNPENKATETEATETETQPATEPTQSNFIKGEIQEVKSGKDGYTAKLVTTDQQVYFATTSHANLADASQYRNVKVGETIEVKGEIWKLENENQITVRELK